ncbi:MAG: DUF4097 family beta strand repeat protein [Gemmatimonadetes bacterium]|nr:DUF4097 family beta strand repeat protein [Gemmatimonadota bacterium]
MFATLLFATTAVAGLTAPDTAVRLGSGASIEINAPTCGVTVRVGTDERLNVTGGSIESDRNNAEVNCDVTTPLRGRDGGLSGMLTITVPPSSRVEITCLSGGVTVTGATDRLDVTTMNGSIRLVNGSGRTSLETVAGNVHVADFKGASLSITAVAGVVSLENVDVAGKLDAESINAGVRMRGVRAASVTASSVNSTVDFVGSLDPDGNYSFESHNGGITLTLPTSTSARLRVSTVMGNFETELKGAMSSGSRQAPMAPPATPRPGKGRTAPPATPVPGFMEETDFTITYGKGEARVSVESFNGPIRIKAAK